MAGDYPIVTFPTQKAFERWLATRHTKAAGIWLRFFKKASKQQSIVYAEALDVALCYGWIDSQSKALDAESYIQKYTPRGKKSIWSKRNREHVARLIKTKRMRAAGLAAVNAAKKDGRWDEAYDSPKNMTVPADFIAAVKKDKTAYALFKTLNRTNLYAIGWRLQTAKKEETRKKRFEALLAMLKQGKKIH